MKNLLVLAAVTMTAVGFAVTTTNTKNTAAQPVVTATTAAAPAATATDATTATVAAPAPQAAKLIGDVELRPTWATKTGTFTTENELMLGYQFNSDLSLSYYQFVNSNLYSRSGEGGLGLSVDDGFVRANVKNIWKSGNASFSYEFRGETPTSASSRDAGKITQLQNRFKLGYDLNKTVSLMLQEIPVLPIYSKAGLGEAANPAFENRVYLITTVNFSDKLSLDIPFLFYQTRNRDFAPTAARNDDWSFKLITWPELTYTVDANLAVGAAYRSSNLLKNEATTSFDLGNGLESGVTQVFLRALL